MEKTIAKMLVERERRWKKMSDVSITFSSPTSQYKHKKKVEVGRHIVIRDRNISSLMLTELQVHLFKTHDMVELAISLSFEK